MWDEDAVDASAGDACGENQKSEQDQAADHASAFDALSVEAVGLVLVTLALEGAGWRGNLHRSGAEFGVGRRGSHCRQFVGSLTR